jgi:hypothetical protein
MSSKAQSNEALFFSLGALASDACLFGAALLQIQQPKAERSPLKMLILGMLLVAIMMDTPTYVQCVAYPEPGCTDPTYFTFTFTCRMLSHTLLGLSSIAILCMWSCTLSAIKMALTKNYFTTSTVLLHRPRSFCPSCCSQNWYFQLFTSCYFEVYWPTFVFLSAALAYFALDVFAIVAAVDKKENNTMVEDFRYRVSLLGEPVAGRNNARLSPYI